MPSHASIDKWYRVPTPGEGLRLVMPYNSYYFLVSHNSTIKEPWWEDKVTNEDERAGRLRDLIKHIGSSGGAAIPGTTCCGAGYLTWKMIYWQMNT